MDIVAQTIPVGELHESPWNPRRHFPSKTLEDLADSIRKVGILSPVLVRPREAGGYEIAAGHRRSRAAKLAKLTEVPAIVRPMGDQEFLEILTIENLQREDVHPLEEAEGYRTLMKQTGWDVDVVAAKVGKSKSYIYQRLKLAGLIDPAKKAFYDETITAGHAILIARLQPKDQAEALKEMSLEDSDKHWYDPMSVRDLGNWIEREIHMDLHSAPWKKDDATLLPDDQAGSCTACPKRSGFSPALFPDLAKKDVCTDRVCFGKKHAAYLARALKRAAEKGEPLLKLGDWSSRGEGYLKRGQDWTEAKPKSCSHVSKGIVMSGHDAGRVITVCAEKSCKEHHGGYRSSGGDGDYARKQKAAEAKAKREGARRRTILTAIREKVTFPMVTREDLSAIAAAFYADIWAEYRKQIATLEGWVAKGQKKNGSVWAAAEDAAQKQIPQLDLDGQVRLLVTMALIKSVSVNTYDSDLAKSGKKLEAAAKRWGVDVATLDAQLKLEEQAKEKKSKPKAGNGRTTAAAPTFDEPTCTNCGCTEFTPCQNEVGEGCSWVQLDKKTNVGLCSACAVEMDPRDVVKKARKSTSKRKAGKPVQTSAAARA